MKPTLTTFQAKPKLPDLPPSYIDICSPFTPRAYSCCQCGNTQHELSFVKGKTVTSCPSLHDPRACIPSHNGETHGCHVWDHLSKPALTQRTPAVFLCATCNAEHSVHEILTQTTVTCECGAPSLEAVYDQFGTILLWSRGDPSVYDLRDAKKVVEARRRLREVGAMPWTEFEARLQEYFEVAGELELSDQVDKIEQSTKRFESSPKELGIRTEMSPSPSLSPSMSPSPSPPPSEEMSSLEEIKMRSER
ncbi:hypothetical protein B0T21DRAFT_385710 [Apiosordaria backusii]|uniref:Uncharacterized protein n=1 Tax=Apiosordaria backusii TaxID=314023 RepID=A0AA40B2I6_9PEZI|nr:hypothetical protein B0T21DRAFT_385710 [Apiosordaria backusii]